MQKGDENQGPTSEDIPEYPAATLLFNGEPYTSIPSSSDVPDYNDIVKVLSQVELPSPSPSPALATSSRFLHEGQSSKIEGGNELKDIHGNIIQAPVTRGTRQRRRSRIHERIRVLKALVPNCNKRDQASILDDAIKHIKNLQMQVQMMQFTGAGTMPQGLYTSTPSFQEPPYFDPMMQFTGAGTMPQGVYMSTPSLQEPPYYDPYPMMMRPMNFGVGHYYGSYFTSVSPVFPPLVNCFDPFVPRMQMGTGSPRLLPIPRLQSPSQISEPVYSTTLSSDTNTATTSQVISSQNPYHMPVTSQEQ